jgi:hypothetical protein
MIPLRLGLCPGQGDGADGRWRRRGMVAETPAICLNLNLWLRSNG